MEAHAGSPALLTSGDSNRGAPLLKLLVIGTVAGIFSGLFGIGGGTVIVPLLIIWVGYGEREATGTSLVAIVLIALFAASTQGIIGNVHLLEGVLIGIPAVFGVLFGTWLQQRVEPYYIYFAFSVLLVGIAIYLVLK